MKISIIGTLKTTRKKKYHLNRKMILRKIIGLALNREDITKFTGKEFF